MQGRRQRHFVQLSSSQSDPSIAHRHKVRKMKHLNTLLQRKHSKFDGGRDAHHFSSSHDIARAAGLQPRDGYDWLQHIKESQPSRVHAH